MIHILSSHAQDLWRRRECAEMPSIPEVSMDAVISSPYLLPSGADIRPVLKSPATTGVALQGRWLMFVTTRFMVTASSGDR